MPMPSDPKEVKKMKLTPKYELADSDDEEDDTVETRRSIKTAEKQLGERFFINAKDKKSFEKNVLEGKVDKQVLDFAEDQDADIEANSTKVALKEKKKKVVAVKKAKVMEIEADKELEPKEKELAVKEVEKDIKKLGESPEDFIPPELAGEMEFAADLLHPEEGPPKQEAATAPEQAALMIAQMKRDNDLKRIATAFKTGDDSFVMFPQ